MHNVFAEFIHVHAKGFGVVGDSLTFLGGIFLALDALFKKAEQINLAAAKLIAKDFPGAQEHSGIRLDPGQIEAKAVDQSLVFAKIGACSLAVGFLCLLLTRLFGE